MKSGTKLKKWSLAKWKKEFWKTFALYIKTRDNWTCFTCGARVKGQGAHAGHFIPKSVCGLALYFSEDNVKCQCVKCNLLLQGNQYEFGKRLGEKKVKELYKIRQENKELQYTKQDYENLIKKYQKKIKWLKKKNLSQATPF